MTTQSLWLEQAKARVVAELCSLADNLLRSVIALMLEVVRLYPDASVANVEASALALQRELQLLLKQVAPAQ